MMIYNRELPPAVVFTWIQLRGLAWDRMETPQVSMAQLSDLTGKSQSTLYAHMALLRSWGALRMRPSVKGSIIVAFPADTGEFFLDGNSLPAQLANRNLYSEKSDKDSEYLERDSENLDSRKLEKGDPPSPSSPLSQPNKDSVEEREGENLPKGKIKDLDLSQASTRRDSENQEINSDKLEIDSEKMEKDSEYSEIESPFFGEDSEKQESDSKNSENLSLRSGDESPFFGDHSEIPEQDPVKIYQTLTGIRPNKPQRQQLKDQVHDSALWSATVEHWQSHGWNPKNVAGILDIYQRGGPAACLCARRKADSRDGSVSALNQLREEFK